MTEDRRLSLKERIDNVQRMLQDPDNGLDERGMKLLQDEHEKLIEIRESIFKKHREKKEREKQGFIKIKDIRVDQDKNKKSLLDRKKKSSYHNEYLEDHRK